MSVAREPDHSFQLQMAFTDPTSLWVCNSLALILFISRLSLRKWRRQDFTKGDYWTMTAAVWVIVRMTISYPILKYGTSLALTDQQRERMDFTEKEIHYLVMNSKLNLLLRVVLISLLWSLKMVVLDLIMLLFRRHWYEHWILWSFYVIFLVTYLLSFMSVFVECRPFKLYWQIYPNPGQCIKGNLWLLIYEVGNIVTDAMLLIPPFTVIFRAKITIAKRLQLSALFSLGLFLLIVSVVRIMQGSGNTKIQLNRTLWASLETLVASIVATIPALYTMIRQHKSSQSSGYEMSGYGTGGRSRVQGLTTTSTCNRGVAVGAIPDRLASKVSTWVELGEASNRGSNDGKEYIGEGDSAKGILVETRIRHDTTDKNDIEWESQGVRS
ncbi:hypothetical protein BGZ61DRAFT_469630 [Ilyonectria robusta]|uniref:uncharacterized protein n=1 Tax=Ilyonectria robusta TaxID=1079257 RepID=UPI001E8D7D2E|nr:uncharacterized protein BGZ61DRAFT_469630 [Ilyonectria robusta]KAH8649010.1 hypothetical protein BGZ61DRAFT_469630 [Ilyonectria robusta]